MSLICPCCDKPINLVEDMEPFFRFPEVIAKMSPSERRARCKLGGEVCSVDHRMPTSRVFIRCVIPIELHDRPERAFKIGAWAEIPDHDDVSRIVQLWNDDAQVEEPGFGALLANDLNRPFFEPPLPPSPLGTACIFQLTGPKTRPYLLFADGVDHPIAAAQRAGACVRDTFVWTRPFHGMVGN